MSDHQSNNINALGLSRRALLAGASSGVGTLAFAAAAFRSPPSFAVLIRKRLERQKVNR